MAQPPSPENTLAINDPGDKILQRYRYQITFAAILAIELLGDPPYGEEVFCEHHEDVLLKLLDGSFHAIQVKTRKPGLELWKANDQKILSSLVKFIKHERDFPTRFSQFTIVTNHQFYREKHNKQNLNYLLDLAQESNTSNSAQMSPILSRYINKLVGIAGPGVDPDIVLRVLKKTNIDDKLPKLQYIERELRDRISKMHPDFHIATIPDLQKIVDSLVLQTFRASSRYDADATRSYLSGAIQSPSTKIQQIIDSKRLTRDHIEQELRATLSSSPLLVSTDPISLDSIPKDLSCMERKLAIGGLSSITVANAYNLHASALYLERQWAAIYGEEKARERYHHVSAVVLNECSNAYEATFSDSKQFGKKMLANLNKKLKQKLNDPATELFDCSQEHLLGHAYTLTERCKVWWSEEFKIPEVG